MWAGHVTTPHSARSAPLAVGCALQIRLEQTPQRKPWSPTQRQSQRRGHKGPHHGTLLCISYGATESPRRQRWAFSAEHPATHTQRSRGRGRQRSVHRQARASERMNERVPGSAAEKGLSLRPRTPPSSSSTPCPTVTHTRGFIFLIKKTTYFLTPISQNQTDAQALQCLHCCLLHLSYFERRWLWTYDTMATEAREPGSWAACHGHHPGSAHGRQHNPFLSLSPQNWPLALLPSQRAPRWLCLPTTTQQLWHT